MKEIINKALNGVFLSQEELIRIYQELSLAEIMHIAQQIRNGFHGDQVGWIIDRNVNISNVCHAGCLFCNFSCSKNSPKAYTTTSDEYKKKIEEMYALGGDQLLLQGGLHPEYGLSFYKDLFSGLKTEFPELKLHALGPPEIDHISRLEGISHQETLEELVESGLDSLPGAGAEILSDEIRKKLSPGKCSVADWLNVMREAHKMDLTTSATMMFGHIETIEDRINHLLLIRDLQAEKPEGHKGFLSFIPWPFQDTNTALAKHHNVRNTVSAQEYVRFFALSRIAIPNIVNFQASWLTIGFPVAQLCLHGGGNDFGSIMIEENVVSVAGASYKTDAEGIQQAIRDAGYIPARRNQNFEFLKS